MKHAPFFFTLLAFLPLGAAALDHAMIENLTGLKGTFNEEEKVFKVTYPRGDLGIVVDDWKMPAFMGLTTWAAVADGKENEAMVMGDLVLLQDEVNPVMSILLEGGLSVTALHNHFFYDNPKAYFMNIAGEGDTEQLAKGVRSLLNKVKELLTAAPQPANSFGGGPLATSATSAAPLIEALGEESLRKRAVW